jgi:hypothetical protein
VRAQRDAHRPALCGRLPATGPDRGAPESGDAQRHCARSNRGDVFTVSARLANTYLVHLRVLDAIHMLVLNDITKALVERLRCEQDIELLSYDSPTHIG